jgi:LysR family glycine cleavage system transcriptional activator
MDRLPSLNAVRYFAAAARLQSFTAAARELYVTQGAISRMVQSLEQDLGVQLFTRNGRTITLTPAGRAYHQEVQAALHRIAEATRRARGATGSEALALIVNAGFATRWLVPRLPAFQRKHPDIHVDILGSEADEHTYASRVQLTIRYGTEAWPGWVATRLPVGSLLGVVCAPSLLPAGPLHRPEELNGRPLLSYTGASRDLWPDYFASYGLPLPDLGHAPRFYQLLMLAEAAMSGLGFALVPLFLFAPELQSGRLVQALPQKFESEKGYFVTHPKGADLDRKVQVFKKWLIAEARHCAKRTESADPDR